MSRIKKSKKEQNKRIGNEKWEESSTEKIYRQSVWCDAIKSINDWLSHKKWKIYLYNFFFCESKNKRVKYSDKSNEEWNIILHIHYYFRPSSVQCIRTDIKSHFQYMFDYFYSCDLIRHVIVITWFRNMLFEAEFSCNDGLFDGMQCSWRFS